MNTVLLIPAYNPEEKLVQILKQLPENAFSRVVVVNDGSRTSCAHIFTQLAQIRNLTLLAHGTNQGKGAALKTGFSYIKEKLPDCLGVVTADADGQHSKKDILTVNEALKINPKVMTIGSRTFDSTVPFRSSFGNKLTRLAMRLFFKIDLSDTQSGLRAIPFSLLEQLMEIRFNRYEFEAEMLMVAKNNQVAFKEIPVQTIYENNNQTSSFNPLVDSAKIYLVLFRYVLASMVTAAVDYAVFFTAYSMIPKIFLCTYFARFIALFINFMLLKQFVFHAKGKIARIIFKYLLLVIVSGFISSLVTQFFNVKLDLSIGLSKVSAELLLYVAVFVVQKEFVFKRKGRDS